MRSRPKLPGLRVALLAAAALFALTASVPPANADRNLPKLYSGAAKFYTGNALKRHFGNSFTHGYAHRADCDQRKSRTRIKCEPLKWVIGDLSYRGWSVIWLKRSPADDQVYSHYAFRIVETNEYCEATGGSNCSKVHRVEGRRVYTRLTVGVATTS